VASQIRGGGAGDDPGLAEAARDQVFRAERADADRQVEPLLEEVDGPVRQRHVDAHVAMAREELGDRGRHVADAERDRGGEPDRAARLDGRLRGLLLGFVEVGEQLDGPLVEQPPALGQADPARRALQEPRLQMRLELGDLARRGGRGNTQPLGGAGEAAQFDDLGERPDGGKAVHGRSLSLFSGQIINKISLYP
jgi:hypothetical protein